MEGRQAIPRCAPRDQVELVSITRSAQPKETHGPRGGASIVEVHASTMLVRQLEVTADESVGSARTGTPERERERERERRERALLGSTPSGGLGHRGLSARGQRLLSTSASFSEASPASQGGRRRMPTRSRSRKGAERRERERERRFIDIKRRQGWRRLRSGFSKLGIKVYALFRVQGFRFRLC